AQGEPPATPKVSDRATTLHPPLLADTPEQFEMLDVFLGGRPTRTCDGASRRDFLRVGSLGLAGLSLPGLLRAESGVKKSAPRAKSVVLVYLGGGISHHDSFDLKPDAPDDVRGKYAPI